MAALTTNVASPAAITVSGNTQKSTTISWTLPTLPNDVTIDSCVLTGRATASMSKGSATIKVNGTTVSSGSNFTINLGTGNNTSSVTATAQGGNKNASGTVTFSNLVYTVNYTGALPKYTVTFLDYDGTVLKTEQVEQGRSATPPADPGRPGYKFTGWDGSYTNVQGDLTITAQYIEAVTYMVRFLDGITYEELKVQYVDAGGSATPPALPTREDSTSTGWSGTYTNVTSDVTILSTYRNKTYTVNFYDYDGNLIRYNTAYHGYSTVPPEAPEKEGYVFIGWDKDLSKITTNLNVNALYEQTNQVLQLKDGGTWKNSLLYKKTNGNWLLQTYDKVPEVFATNIKYTREPVQKNTAVLYADGTLVISPDSRIDPQYGVVVGIYYDCDKLVYQSASMVPWQSNPVSITRVIFNDVTVSNARGWFGQSAKALPITSIGGKLTVKGDISNMVYANRTITSFDFDYLDTSKVTSFGMMFSACTKLTSINTAQFNTSSATELTGMFDQCHGLTSIDVSGFDVTNVTSTNSMFSSCLYLTDINMGDFYTPNLKRAKNMFSKTKITEIDLSSFDTSQTYDVSSMFSSCTNLRKVDLSNADLSKATVTSNMFQSCNAAGLQIFVRDEIAKRKIESSTNFPSSTATVIIGKP